MKPILTLLALLALCCGRSPAADAKRPNILFILVDDQSPFDLKCYNPQSPLETPHIDRLARDGMVFDGAYHIAQPETSEGVSFKPVLTGQKSAVRDVLYGVYNGGTKPGMRSVKQGDWKLIQYEVMNGGVRETQLFNLKDNPEEFLVEHHDAKVTALTGAKPAEHQVNLAADPKHAAKLAEMQALLLAEMRRLHDPWRLWNQPADGLTPPPEGPLSGQGKAKRKQK